MWIILLKSGLTTRLEGCQELEREYVVIGLLEGGGQPPRLPWPHPACMCNYIHPDVVYVSLVMFDKICVFLTFTCVNINILAQNTDVYPYLHININPQLAQGLRLIINIHQLYPSLVSSLQHIHGSHHDVARQEKANGPQDKELHNPKKKLFQKVSYTF